MHNVCSIRRLADTAEKTAAAVGEGFQVVYAQCSSLAQQVGESSKRFEK